MATRTVTFSVVDTTGAPVSTPVTFSPSWGKLHEIVAPAGASTVVLEIPNISSKMPWYASPGDGHMLAGESEPIDVQSPTTPPVKIVVRDKPGRSVDDVAGLQDVLNTKVSAAPGSEPIVIGVGSQLPASAAPGSFFIVLPGA